MYFNKILDDLVTIKDEDYALVLLWAIPISFDHFKDTMVYGK